ncbi:MAG: LysM domain-containing protein [Verrucomicrobiota bacterium]
MKKYLMVALLAASPVFLRAADSFGDAAAVAAQRESEERSKRLAADLQTIQEAQELILKRQDEFRRRLDKLADEVQAIKDDQTRSAGNFASRDELRKYIEKLKEQLDEQREADKKLILNNIKELAKTPPAPVSETKAAARRNPEPEGEPAFVYVIKKNDTLSDIIAEYNDYFQKNGQAKISKEQVLKANPGLNPDVLVTGKKIRIPPPAKLAGK